MNKNGSKVKPFTNICFIIKILVAFYGKSQTYLKTNKYQYWPGLYCKQTIQKTPFKRAI